MLAAVMTAIGFLATAAAIGFLATAAALGFVAALAAALALVGSRERGRG